MTQTAAKLVPSGGMGKPLRACPCVASMGATASAVGRADVARPRHGRLQPGAVAGRGTHLHRTGVVPRGSVVVVVLWAIAIAAVVAGSMQLFGQRQAMIGREAVSRVQARWAARAGVEATIAVMIQHTTRPDPHDAFAMIRAMDAVAIDESLAGAGYDIRHHSDGRDWSGPLDEHSRINLHQTEQGVTRIELSSLRDMTPDLLDAIDDWQDKDEDVRTEGAEGDYYANLAFPYAPRNGAIRTIGELELIASWFPDRNRGEDWNLNNRLDANEDDGGRTWPEDDNGDSILDYGWSGNITVHSVGNGATGSGLPRIRLGLAEAPVLVERLGVDATQAAALIQFGRNPASRMSQFLSSSAPGSTGSTTGGAGSSGSSGSRRGSRRGEQAGASSTGSQVPQLTEEQVRTVMAETMIEGEHTRVPGKINLNTVPQRFLYDFMETLVGDDALADEIIYLRNSNPGGITSLLELKKIPGLSRAGPSAQLENLARYFDTTSNVFTISCRGRSWSTGLEVEIIAVVDRSTLPVRILEYREQ